MTTLTSKLKSRQLPGRLESLGAVIAGNATEEQRRVAGLGRNPVPRQPLPFFGTVQMTSGIEQLTAQERVSLPF